MAALSALVKRGQEWNWVWDEASAAASGVPYPYPGFSNYSFMALSPYPTVAETWGPLFFVGSPLGSSDYNALQLTLNKRMSSGLAANVEMPHPIFLESGAGCRVVDADGNSYIDTSVGFGLHILGHRHTKGQGVGQAARACPACPRPAAGPSPTGRPRPAARAARARACTGAAAQPAHRRRRR